jgi:hypothetical protein
MLLMQELNNELTILKICKTCNESKELSLYRPHTKDCRKCANKKKKNVTELNKKYYEKNKEQLKEQNLINYYRRKYNNESLTVREINLLMVMCK